MAAPLGPDAIMKHIAIVLAPAAWPRTTCMFITCLL
jgi:hypothetical protein